MIWDFQKVWSILADSCEVQVHVAQQGPNIALSIHGHFAKHPKGIGVWDQDHMFSLAVGRVSLLLGGIDTDAVIFGQQINTHLFSCMHGHSCIPVKPTHLNLPWHLPYACMATQNSSEAFLKAPDSPIHVHENHAKPATFPPHFLHTQRSLSNHHPISHTTRNPTQNH